jgi:integrase
MSSIPLSGTTLVRHGCQSAIFLRDRSPHSPRKPNSSRKMPASVREDSVAYVRPYGKGQFRCEVEKLGVRDSQIFDRKGDAQRWGIQREAEIEAEKTGRGVTFSQVAGRYLREVSTKKKSAVEWETRRMGYFAEFFGASTPVLTITRKKVAAWVDHRLQTVTGSTVNREANLLSNLFRKARMWEYMTGNPMEGVDWPDDEDPRTVVWRWQQVRRVLRYCQGSQGVKTQQVGIAFHIALRTAMRAKEVLLASKRGQLAVISDSKTTRKGKEVTIPLTHQGRRVMTRYAGTPWVVEANELSVLFHKAALACGVRVKGEDGPTFHDARATALTHMARRMPVEQLQRISRHRDINVLTRTYYRITNEQIAANL